MGDDKELQKPVLPTDIFRSKLTFDIYEINTFRLPWVVSSLSLGLGCIAARTFSLSNMAVFLCIELAFMFPPTYLEYKRQRLDITSLVQQILELKPGTDAQRWDEVAHKLNLAFYQEGFWNTPYRFFASWHAHLFFLMTVVRPYFEGKLDDITDADKVQSVCDYLQSLNEQFEMSLKSDLPQLPLNAELPRDTQKSFFFFFQRLHTIQIIVLCFQQGMGFFLLWGAAFDALHRFALFLVCQCGSWASYYFYTRSLSPELGLIRVIHFLAIITKVNPGKELDNWDQIAMHMNRYVIEENGGYSKHIFFDGKHCLNFYRTYLEPLSVDSNTNGLFNLKEIVKIVQSKIE